MLEPVDRPQAFQSADELSAYAPALGAVARSGRLGNFDVATREDYERVLRQHDALGAAEALVRRPDLVAVVQAHWHASGGDPCVFAQHMSARRDEHGWETFVLADHGSAEADADALGTCPQGASRRRRPRW
jgi:hypothetical protein